MKVARELASWIMEVAIATTLGAPSPENLEERMTLLEEEARHMGGATFRAQGQILCVDSMGLWYLLPEPA